MIWRGLIATLISITRFDSTDDRDLPEVELARARKHPRHGREVGSASDYYLVSFGHVSVRYLSSLLHLCTSPMTRLQLRIASSRTLASVMSLPSDFPNVNG